MGTRFWRSVGLIAALACVASTAAAQVTATPAEARKIAAEVYLYGFPVVDNYKTMYDQAINAGGPDYHAPINQIGNAVNVASPDDKSIITPNSDTPYSFLWMDLRTQPLVLTLPKVDPKRYYVVQLVDLFTYNFAYLGRRTTGSNGGNFLIAAPTWKAPTPKGITKAIYCDTEIAYALYRTQLFNDRDIDEVRKVQAGYKVQTLSAFAGTPAPKAPPVVNWPKSGADMLDSLALFKYLNFLLAFAPTHPDEKALMQRFAKIGVGPGKPFDVAALSPDMKPALEAGIADGKQQFAEFKKTQIDTHKVDSSRLFGTREELKNNYMYRFAGARLGIYGNSGAEAIYVGGFVDADGQPVDASKHRYVMRFPKGGLPPNDAFWSLTMYDGKTQLLVANPLKRYLINSSMEPQLKRDADGGVTLYVQAESPGAAWLGAREGKARILLGADKESNWLPAPKGPFYTILRIYQPKPEVQSGKWKAPPLRKAD